MVTAQHGDVLEHDEARYRLLVDAITDYAVYTLSPSGIVTSWNKGAERFKGYEAGEILGEHFSRFYTEADRAAGLPQKALAAAAQAGRFEAEGWRVRKDGTRFWAHVIIDPIISPYGDLIGYAKVTRDITEKIEAQRSLEQAREALIQSQKLEAIGQLTGGIAHDFNNLLMAILGSLELARRRLPKDSSVLPLLENAEHAAQRGGALIQRMLTFARGQEMERKPTDLLELVRGMTELLQRAIGPHITIRTDFPLSLPKADTDPNHLETALLNLALNARDAMSEGGSITISGRIETVGESDARGLKPGRYVCISVADTGTGMDERTLARAIEPFFSTKRPGKGTGLGLPMVHGIAEQSGGKLVLKSRLGEGTIAEMWLRPAEGRDELGRTHADEGAWKPGASSSMNIIAVDDDVLVLMNTVAMLQELGHNVFSATSGAQALDILRREPSIDAIVTDHAMPHMSGVELARLARAEKGDIPILMATGYADLPGERSEIALINKPFSLSELQRAVERLRD